MKTFIFTVTNRRKTKMGSFLQNITVYRIKKNQPILVGKKEINTASYKGDRSTAFTILHEEGEIPEKLFEESGGYYNPKAEEEGYKIIKLNPDFL